MVLSLTNLTATKRDFMKSLGKFILFIGQLFVRRETFNTYLVQFFDECIKVGYKSVFIIIIISAFMGAVTTVQTAYNLVSPLISHPIIALVVRDMTLLELAPTIMAIIYAGKVGSNLSSEIGTMRITEQIDALEVMGINAASYLALPKIIASVVMFPVLVIISGFVTMYGGYITATITNVISGNDFITGIQMDFNPFQVVFALIKAVVFGFLVASISSYTGFYVKGGALEVGKASTGAVTNSCIGIVVADFLLAYLLAPLLKHMIEVKNISKSFGDKSILKDISLTFKKGKISMIIGASGTGKSVLLKCIVGLIMPDSGILLYDNRKFAKSNKEVQTQIRREMGMLFQGGALFDSQTVEENIMFPLNMLTKLSLEEKKERINAVLVRVGLENINKKMPSEISGGMKKRVGIARAIVNNPNYLFCDEPNSGLDPQTSIKIDNLIKDITEDYNITTIVVSHDMNSVLQAGDVINFMHQGEIIWSGIE